MHDPKQILYILGIPGSGKTSLLRAALDPLEPTAAAEGIVRYLAYPGGIELGAIRPPFSGTDALELRVQPLALAWLTGACPYRYVIAEGERLANLTFFTAMQRAGWALSIAYLACPLPLALVRREGRPLVGKRAKKRHGATPPAAWLKGRVTKITNLTTALAPLCWQLDARLPLDTLARTLRGHPVYRALAGENG